MASATSENFNFKGYTSSSRIAEISLRTSILRLSSSLPLPFSLRIALICFLVSSPADLNLVRISSISADLSTVSVVSSIGVSSVSIGVSSIIGVSTLGVEVDVIGVSTLIVVRDDNMAIDTKSHFKYIVPKVEFGVDNFINAVTEAL